jgi:sigma-B regulation protein RsbU (phosphoserine phosphatase)
MVVRERLETEVQLARQIQQTFIPQALPKHPAWQLAARWRTARQVGGDFYDVIELPNKKLGIFIADVADKGMPAALFMALTRTLMRAAVIETDSPAEALGRVNDLLLPDTQQGMFVTAVYGELDMEHGKFTYVNAGHNPPFWVKANGEIEKLTRTAVALGVMEQPNIQERTISISFGDKLLLYTDGSQRHFLPKATFLETHD